MLNFTSHSLKRGSDGRFKDDDLARTIQDATECRAGAFKARGTPEALRVIEILGIEQGRAWGTCSVCILVSLLPHILTFF
jgi:linoleate 10R-lipoxygenase